MYSKLEEALNTFMADLFKQGKNLDSLVIDGETITLKEVSDFNYLTVFSTSL